MTENMLGDVQVSSCILLPLRATSMSAAKSFRGFGSSIQRHWQISFRIVINVEYRGLTLNISGLDATCLCLARLWVPSDFKWAGDTPISVKYDAVIVHSTHTT